LREAAGIGAQTWNYDQTALVTNVLTQRFHDHVAYERFTPSGPLALLPMSEGRGWASSGPSHLTSRKRLFRRTTRVPGPAAGRFGIRLGRFMRVGGAAALSARAHAADEHVAERLGDRRQCRSRPCIHRGQGFNLGLRDAGQPGGSDWQTAVRRQRDAFDPGDGLWLERYREWRQADRTNIVRFTDGLVRLFAQPLGPIKALRDVGMLAFDLMPAAKGALSQLSLRRSWADSKLARGASLL
jgi:2-octaprenyl-6-methoxyphenol hydroxylase